MGSTYASNPFVRYRACSIICQGRILLGKHIPPGKLGFKQEPLYSPDSIFKRGCGNESTRITHIDDPASADQIAEWDRVDSITGFQIMNRSIDVRPTR